MYIKRILLIIALLGLVGLGIFSYFIYDTLLVPNTAFSAPQTYVYIKNDATYKEVLAQLDSLLKRPHKFDIAARQKKYAQHVKPGRYRLVKGMNNNQIINILRSKNMPLSVVFNNQDRLPELARRIAEQIEADSTSLMQVMTDSTFLTNHGFTPADALDLYIPNTYQFYWNTTAEEFRARMVKEYQRFWTAHRKQKAKAIGLTPNEVQVLASIVQKETNEKEERRKIAGVYINRLNRGMKLQADPTVVYAFQRKNNDYDTIIRRVLYKDLDIQSPYNTYLHTGLPPGPIAMPDIVSIKAVLNYEKNPYYYFVADPKRPGYHKFAKTLAQHNRNKSAYDRYLRKKHIYR